jgi:hypothetical protein
MRRIKSKHMRKYKIKILIDTDINEYLDDINEWLCGCNCCICNPYYGDHLEYFVMQDEWIYENTPQDEWIYKNPISLSMIIMNCGK